jgi:hypothetical protein
VRGCWQVSEGPTADIVIWSVELEHLFEELLDCLFGVLGGDRIVTSMHAVNDAGVRVGEWLLGVGVYQKPFSLLLDLAVARALVSSRLLNFSPADRLGRI